MGMSTLYSCLIGSKDGILWCSRWWRTRISSTYCESLNTNVDGKQKVMLALTSIKAIGWRFADIVCKKADVDMNKRVGELSAEELENLIMVVANQGNSISQTGS